MIEHKQVIPYDLSKNDDVKYWEDGKQLYFFDFEALTRPKREIRINTNGNELNNLSGSEWTLLGKSVQSYNSAITEKRKTHGAAFPIDLAKHLIKVYSKIGDTVIDPFAGVGTTLDAANILGRHSIGTELNPHFINLFNHGIDPKDGKSNSEFRRIVIQDSALNIGNHLANSSADFILTSPPYANLLNKIRNSFADKDYNGNTYKNQSRKLARPYSNHEDDLGNVHYDVYLKKVTDLFKNLYDIAKEGAYNAWVVRDYRDFENNIPYVSLHTDLMRIAQESGWIMWDIIIWDQSNQRKLVRLGGNKSRRYYFNIGHSFILVFRKNIKGEKFR